MFAAVAAVDLNELHATLPGFIQDVNEQLDTTRASFLAQVPPVVDENFDFERAHRVVEYVAEQLEHVTDSENEVAIPFVIEEPTAFHFPEAKTTFDHALDECEQASIAQKARIACKILVGVAAIVAAPVTLGGSLAVAGACVLASGADLWASAPLTEAEVTLKYKAGTAYGTAAPLWGLDAMKLDYVLDRAATFLLNESAAPNHLDENETLEATITSLDLHAAEFFGRKIVVAPWFGGEPSQPAEIRIENTRNAASTVFTRINRLWRHYPAWELPATELPVGGEWDVDDGAHRYVTDPYVPWFTFIPRRFRVDAYAGLPDSPTDSAYVDYFLLPWWPGRGGTLVLSTPLPLSTGKGQLTLRDTGELYPVEYVLWEGDLTPSNVSVEVQHTARGISPLFCAQRLSASGRGTHAREQAECQRTGVLNAFRHQGGGHHA